jgi:hypothetical protein
VGAGAVAALLPSVHSSPGENRWSTIVELQTQAARTIQKKEISIARNKAHIRFHAKHIHRQSKAAVAQCEADLLAFYPT